MRVKEALGNIEEMIAESDLLEKYPIVLDQINDNDQANNIRILELLLGLACNRYTDMTPLQLFEEARRRGLFASRPAVLVNKHHENETAWFRLRYGKYVKFKDDEFTVTNVAKDSENARIIAKSRPTLAEDITAAAKISKVYRHSLQAVFVSYFIDAVYGIDEVWEKPYLMRRPMVEFMKHSLAYAPEFQWLSKCADPDIYIENADDASWLREVNDDTRVFVTGDTLVVEKTLSGGVVAKWCCSELPIPTEQDTRIFMYHILMLLWMIGIKPSRRFVEECFSCEEVV